MKRAVKALLSSISIFAVASFLVGSLGGFMVLADETTTPAAKSKKNLTTEAKNLYYGYNITGGKSLMEADAIAKVHPVIDLNSDYPIERTELSGEQENKNYASFSLRDLVEEYATSVAGGIEGSGKINAIRLSANLGVAFNTETRVSNVYSEYYEMYSCKIEKESYIVHNLEARDIRKYLSAKFVDDINSIRSTSDAEAFFKKYGTHLSTGYKYGGLMNITNYKTTSDSSVQLNRGLTLDTKISAAISKASAGISFSLSDMYGSSETTSESTSTYNFKSYGGEAVAGVNIDSLFTYNPSLTGNGKYEYGRWVDSINAGTNLAIIGVANGCELIPLWDLLEPNANPNIRKYMINAYVEMCGDKYEEYLKMYPTLNRTISKQQNSEDSSAPVVDGAFIRTKNDFIYYVKNTDFDLSNGTHKEIHEGDLIYLSISNPTAENYDYVCSGCEVVDKRSALFRVTGKNNDNLSIKYKDNKVDEVLLNLNVKSCNFEGGSGTKAYPYLISEADQFLKLNNAKEETYYRLVKDIDFKGKTIHPLGTLNGVLDGNYCCISNFKIEETGKSGLFSEIGASGEVKNLKIQNAGTCLTAKEFSLSKAALELEKPTKVHAISSSSAGIICGINRGNILDCLVIDCYLCNVDTNGSLLKDDANRKGQKCVVMSSGLLAGENDKNISECMVKNSSVLCAYVNNGDNNKDNIFVYSGGLVGRGLSGTINKCALINDSEHKIISVTGNNNKLNVFAANNEVRTYASGLIGYCEKDSSVTLNSVYAQIYANNIEAKTYKFGKVKSNPDLYHHLKSIVAIAADKTMSMSDCHAYCDSKDKMRYVLIPNNKRADNIDSTKSYEIYDEAFDENGNKKLSKNTNIDDSVFYFDNQDSIHHFLERDKAEYISLNIDSNDSSIKTLYCKGDRVTFNGLNLQGKARDGKEMLEPVIFSAHILEKGLVKEIDTPLTTLGNGSYSIKISAFDQKVICNETPSLEVNDNAISGLVVENKTNNIIYLDKVEEFVSTWNPKDLTVTAILSNGTKVAETDKSFASLLDKTKIELATTAKEIAKGDNYIKVKYVLNGHELNASYIVTAIERQVTSIKIQEAPAKNEYQAGEKVDLSGIKVLINYDQGSSDLCVDKNKLSITGDTVAEGENVVVVTYEGYLNCSDSFTVNGKPSTSSGDSKLVKTDNSPITGAKKVFSTIVKVILIVIGVIVAVIICIVVVAIVVSKKKIVTKPSDESDKTIKEHNDSENGVVSETTNENKPENDEPDNDKG